MIVLWILIGLVLFFGFVVFFGAPYVPSQTRYVKRALTALYPIGPADVLVDIGAGDGRILKVATAQGARAIGYELQPLLWIVAILRLRGQPLAKVVLANFWSQALPDDTTVVYAFSVHRDQDRLARKLQAFADSQGRVVSLLSYGNPLPQEPTATFEAYFLYEFHPSQKKELTV